MKKFLLTVFTNGLLFTMSFATIHKVQVANFQFSPKTLTAVVGDTIEWDWVSGFHTTTSTNVPAGAATWDAPMTSSATSFQYKLTAAGAYDYVCSIHPNMTATLTVTGTLPVVLTDLSASAAANKKALIAWHTAGEINTTYFSVQRSFDGDDFSEVAKVNAAGNSVLPKSYSYTDNDVANKTRYVYYMLEIFNKDGSSSKSKIVMFHNQLTKAGLIVQMSPNPVTGAGHLLLKFNADKPGTMHAQLFNNSGRLLLQKDMMAVEGINNGHFHLGDVPAGIYTAVFTLDGIKETKRVVISK